jgi:excisionase family DNA binding protein
MNGKVQQQRTSNRMSIPEIAQRLDIGRLAVYAMLEQGIIPAVRLGRRWIVTRNAYERWEKNCGYKDNEAMHPVRGDAAVVGVLAQEYGGSGLPV